MWGEDDVRLVPLEWLKPHEEIKERNRDKLLDMTKRWKGYTKPLIVDKRTGSILDGHHRFEVVKKMNKFTFLKSIITFFLSFLSTQS